jgi:hypothetical protein
MLTPDFPALRSRLAALGRRTAHTVRPTTLAQLQQPRRDWLPAPLLASEEEGPNSRERLYTLRLTFACFLWQLLKPRTSCREVVRQVQALLRTVVRMRAASRPWSRLGRAPMTMMASASCNFVSASAVNSGWGHRCIKVVLALLTYAETVSFGHQTLSHLPPLACSSTASTFFRF